MAAVSLNRPEGLLAGYLRRAAAVPFHRGQLYCWAFVADWIVMVRGGDDPAASLRCESSVRFGSLRALVRRGASSYLDIVAMLAADANLPEIDPRALCRGDFAAVSMPRRHVAALICTGRHFAAKSGPGLRWGPVDRSVITRAWSIHD